MSQQNSNMNVKYNLKSTRKRLKFGGLRLTATTFCRENWVEDQTESYEVLLKRDSEMGLGITVAGYVHKKEEILGIFVKGLVPGSNAQKDGHIEQHDLIIKVNETSLEGVSHANCVQELVSCGNQVNLELVRFKPGSPQAKYLDILRGHDSASNHTQDNPVTSEEAKVDEEAVVASEEMVSNHKDSLSSEDQLKLKWKSILPHDRDIILCHVPENNSCDGLGLSLEGTVDVVDGAETSAHHYINDVDETAPQQIRAVLRPGDELLEVNGVKLFGESHLDVVKTLSNLESQATTVVVARFIPSAQLFQPVHSVGNQKQPMPERLVKAKSEINLNPAWDTYELLEEVARRLRSRSLEPLNSLAVWSTTPTVIYLNKGARGLGFSVLDYQDPLHPCETVIVVRSLVPGGVASQDGRVIPGDRLLFVNERDLHNADLANAVDALKSAPKGEVKIGLAKPMPFHNEENMTEPPIITQTERLLAKGALASPLTKRKRKEKKLQESATPPPLPNRPPPHWSNSAEQRRRLDPQAYYSRSYALYGSLPHSSKAASTLSGSWLSMNSWSGASTPSLSPAPSPSSLLRGSWASDIVHIPHSMEHTFKLDKGPDPLGIVVESVDKAVNGCQVRTMLRSGAFGKDGRVHVGDFITRLNNQTLRNATNSQAKAILNRTNLICTSIPVTYIPGTEAEKYKEKVEKNPVSDSPAPSVNRLSPKSPYFSRKEFVPSDVDVLSGEVSEGESDLLSTTADVSSRLMTSQSTTAADFESAEAAANWVLSKSVVEEAIRQAVSFLTADKQSIIEKMIVIEETASDREESPKEDDLDLAITHFPSTSSDNRIDDNEQIANEIDDSIKIRQKVTAKNSAAPSEGASSGNSESLISSSSTRSKYWGEARNVTLVRQPSRSLGISIVGGRVEVSQRGGLPGTGTTVSGIFIKSVLAGSPAGKSGQMAMGDRILSVNGVDLREATHEDAVEVIKSAANPIKFVLQSLHSIPTHQGASGGSTPCNGSAPSSSPSTPSMSKKERKMSPPLDESVSVSTSCTLSSAATIIESTCAIIASPTEARATLETQACEVITPDPETVVTPKTLMRRNTETQIKAASENMKPMGAHEHEMRTTRVSSLSEVNSCGKPPLPRDSPSKMTTIPRGRVDSMSAAALAKMQEDTDIEDEFGYTAKKVVARYGELDGELISIELERNANGLGLSLVGNRDRSKMSIFVCGISNNGSAAKAKNKIRIGDQVLEINGIVLQGRSHLNASAIIRGLKDANLKLILLRHSSGVEEMALNSNGSAIPTSPESVIESKSESVSRSIHTIGETEESKENEPPPAAAVTCLPPALQPRKVVIERGPDGYGITLTEGTTTDNLRGIFVTNISPESPVAKTRYLQVGDQILYVNGQQVGTSSSATVAQIIQSSSGNQVELTVSTHMVVPLPSSGSPRRSPQKTPDIPEDSSPSTSSFPYPPPPGISVCPLDAERRPSPTVNLLINAIVIGEETTIEIEKGGKGLGLSIVGGSDTVLGSVVIHEVYSDGAAAKDARLKPGDQVLEVNSKSLRDVNHDDAISLLRQTPSRVRLLVFRDPNLQLSLLDPSQIYNVFEVELTKKPGRGLGLSIVGRKTEPGVYVSEVVKGGAAEADGRLSQGDQILAVNAQDLTNSMQEQAATILKTCMGKVTLRIGRWKLTEGGSSSSGPSGQLSTAQGGQIGSPIIPTSRKPTSSSESSAAQISSLDSKPAQDQASDPAPQIAPDVPTKPVIVTTPEPASEPESQPVENTEPSVTKSKDSIVSNVAVEIPAPILNATPIGPEYITVNLEKKPDVQLGMGIGKRPRGVLVTSLQPGSQAANHLKVGDKIVAVNGTSVPDCDQSTAVRLVKESGAQLSLQICRMPDSNLSNIITISLRRGEEEGLGFSIVGGSNTKAGNLPIFVKSVYSKGAAAIDGQLKQGDRILTVNGQSLENVSHDLAVDLLKQARGNVELLVSPADEH